MVLLLSEAVGWIGLDYILYSFTDYTFEFHSASQMIYYINCLTSNPFNNLRVCPEFRHLVLLPAIQGKIICTILVY